MGATNLDLEPSQQRTQAQALMSFLCPCCARRLNVPVSLAGVAGPCPACDQVIRAPKAQAQILQPLPESHFQVTTSEVILPPVDPYWDELEPSAPEVIRFSALKRIAPPPVGGLDDSWREKVERRRKQSRKRRRRHRLLKSLLVSRRSAKIRKIGIALIAVVLVLTFSLLYLNR